MFDFIVAIMQPVGNIMKQKIKEGFSECQHFTHGSMDHMGDECRHDYKRFIQLFMVSKRNQLIQTYSSRYNQCIEKEKQPERCKHIIEEAKPSSQKLKEIMLKYTYNIPDSVYLKRQINRISHDFDDVGREIREQLALKYCKGDDNQKRNCMINIQGQLSGFIKESYAKLHETDDSILTQCLVNNPRSKQCIRELLKTKGQQFEQLKRKLLFHPISTESL